MEEQLEANSVTKNKLETNIKTLKAKIASVMEKQFAGIDVENIKQQYNAAKNHHQVMKYSHLKKANGNPKQAVCFKVCR